MTFFFHLQNQRTGGENRSCLGVLVPVGGGGDVERTWEGKYGANVHMYVNGKMRPVETVPGMRERG
jgi:hypothetical protein